MLVGRPRLQVLEEHLQTLHNDAGFRWANIGRILGISDQALHRRRREFGLQVGMGEHFSDITDDERDVNLSEILQATPNTCQGLGEGGLRHRGLYIHTRKQYSECQCLLRRPSCWVESTQQNKKSTAYPVIKTRASQGFFEQGRQFHIKASLTQGLVQLKCVHVETRLDQICLRSSLWHLIIFGIGKQANIFIHEVWLSDS